MAALNDTPLVHRRKAGVCYMRKQNPRTDMTPMVDLGFLLICFFVFTTVMNKPVVTNLDMPHDGPPMKLEMSNALTVLLEDHHTLYYYHGEMNQAFASGGVVKTSFDVKQGIGQVIREKQKYLEQLKTLKEGKNGLMLLIKPTTMTDYNDLLKILDETLINDVKKYAIVKPEPEELNYLQEQDRFLRH